MRRNSSYRTTIQYHHTYVCWQVVGLEIVPDAVKDATHNAELNNVTNARYICGKAEETLKTCLEQYRDVPVIAVVDPPRAGLHHETLNALRRCNSIKTIVYVMCNPRQCTDNIKRLLGPCSKKLRQMPFRVVKAIPVDLFPHTPHTELVVMLERIEEPGASTSSSSSSSSLSSLSSSPSVPLSSSSSAVTTNFATEAIAVATTEALVIPTAAPVENLTVAAVTTPASTALAPGDEVAGPG
jgi:tRNA (uracil-5-)-methyltransferase